MTIATDLKGKLAERDRLTEEIVKIAKEEFGAMVSGIFEKYSLENFAWTQYSDEYNDEGDYPFDLHTNVEVSEGRYGSLNVNLWESGDNHYADIKILWNQFPHWLLLEMFGDYSTIVCFPDRVEVVDYDRY